MSINIGLIKKLKKRIWIWIFSILFLSGFFFSFVSSSYFEIAKNLDIFASLYREVNTYYVDDIEPTKIMKKGIDAMLETLDPYTNYIPEDEIEDLRFVTTGQYGGIGATIGQFNEEIILLEPYEGFPAQKAGLKAGDKILSIDGKTTKGKNTTDVSKILKGQPGSNVTLSIISSVNNKESKVDLVREEIKIENIYYNDLLDQDVGYIYLKGFTQKAGKEIKDAMVVLKEKGAKKFIIDLRDNPGGLLNEAVTISNLFVPKGREIVSTRGKVKEWDKIYEALNPAYDTEVPLVILINKGSASASEIVSGVIQDYDRGVIIGERSFGKGLVQTTRPLSYKSQLKVTTAKYYTPSGRCIQAVDYSNRNENGSVGKIADSVRTAFKTKNGRTVYDGGGIEPDITIPKKTYASITQSLLLKRLIFNYAIKFRNEHNSIVPPEEFKLSEQEYQDFIKWISDKDYDYTTKSEKALEDLKVSTESESYFQNLKDEYKSLEQKIKHNKNEDLDRYKNEILEVLTQDIIKMYYYQKGFTKITLKSDPYILTSIELLKDPEKYEAILKGNQRK